jgi:hypothetical protein
MPFQIRRGTNAERLTITPLEGELIYTTDTKLIYVGDGTTVGGITGNQSLMQSLARVLSVNGLSGNVGISAGTGLSLTTSGNTLTFTNIGINAINSVTGNISLIGASGISISASGNTFTFFGTDYLYNVKDYGAQGNGVSNDVNAINAAFTAALSAGSTLPVCVYFPMGTYLIHTNLTTRNLNKNLKILGQNALLKANQNISPGLTQYPYLMEYDLNGKTLLIDGLNFDGNNCTSRLLNVYETSTQGLSTVKIENCDFQNSYAPGLSGAAGEAKYFESYLALINGGFNEVLVANCTFKNCSRSSGATHGGVSQALNIQGHGSSADRKYPNSVIVTNNFFENVTSGITSTQNLNNWNVDCDCLSVFGGYGVYYPTAGLSSWVGNTFISSKAIITNNSFKNCKGRSVKTQTDDLIIAHNQFYHSILPISDGGVEAQIQTNTGKISHNVFYYHPTANNQSPFQTTGVSFAGLSLNPLLPGASYATISLQDSGTRTVIGVGGEISTRRAKSVEITNNLVINNVPANIGTLRFFLNTRETTTSTSTTTGYGPSGAYAYAPYHVICSQNSIVGGDIQSFLLTWFRNKDTDGISFDTGTQGITQTKAYYTITDNFIQGMLPSAVTVSSTNGPRSTGGSFIQAGNFGSGSGFNLEDYAKPYNELYIANNKNAGATTVPLCVLSYETFNQTYNLNVTALNNFGIVPYFKTPLVIPTQYTSLNQTPASNAYGETGAMAWDTQYLYVCIGTTGSASNPQGIWRRVGLTAY